MATKDMLMEEFWESSFREKQEMWGAEPAEATLVAMRLFQEARLRTLLIPGFGYGRNARPFAENGFSVTGIEISETAIALGKKQFGDSISVHHGSVADMPFGDERFDGIFCYALIHLLGEAARAKLVRDCHDQLEPGGYMVFVALSTADHRHGEGKAVAKDTFETRHGITLFFYDRAAVEHAFGRYGLIEAVEYDEPATPSPGQPSQRFWRITCKKG